MSTTTEHYNLLKLVILVMEYGTKVLKEKVKSELSKGYKTFQDLVKASRHDLIHLHELKRCCACTSYPTARHSAISYKQLALLLDNDRGQACTRPNNDRDQLCTCGFKEKMNISENDMDITLLSCFLLNIIKQDDTVRKLIKNLRDKRNNLFHLISAKVPMEEFETKFQDIAHIINEIAKGFDTELFVTFRSQMIDLESSACSPQQLHCAMELKTS
ncbi:uncharacterized protein LOC110448967 [Mizuhopecten yessoensis]|uniref:uncharacterized protein LOC110448967 n=1 Tax=Mizuhopecten yessoensis TaxID=6573 RepID=UPI000B45C129|nr:uncharacterized protein LOC110448967 [Mizuhopecten yessoensis]